MSDVTKILSQIEQGDPSAAEQLLPLVYEELRKLAAAKLADEKPGQTLQATSLVHEAYVRLVDVEKTQHWESRGHFFAAAAEAMRRILVDSARRRESLKHGGNLERVDLPAEFEEGWVHGLGPWLFVEGEDGTAQRLEPSTMATVGSPISLNGFGSLGYPKIDEANMRFAANNGEVVKIFDLATGRQLGRELPHSTNIADRIEFSGDGTILSVPNEDRVTLWNYDTDSWAEIACEFAGRNMTREEWDQFGPRTIEYRATCSQFGLP